jgi:hypothetical protein
MATRAVLQDVGISTVVLRAERHRVQDMRDVVALQLAFNGAMRGHNQILKECGETFTA